MICTDIVPPTYLIFSKDASALLYYSHIPAVVVALLFGLFIFLNGKQFLVNRILFAISIVFSLWTILSLIVWTNVNSDVIIFCWALFGILSSMLGLLCAYFVYVFINKKDIPFGAKLVSGLIMLPIIALSPTKYNLGGFDLSICDSSGYENIYFLVYYYSIVFLSFLWILFYGTYRCFRSRDEDRKQILWLMFGVGFFLFAFFVTGFLASYLAKNGIISDFGMEFYGLMSMPVFLGVLTYLIVKFQVFNFKVLGAQALVYTIVVLVGSQLFFIKTLTNFILTSITLILTAIFGSVLIASVRLEVRRKEELQYISHALAVSNARLKSADDSKNEFISIASHQLRTPLTVIKGYIALMFDGSYGKIPESLEQVMKNIMVSNNRLIELVEDLLNISRMESGRMEYRYARMDVMDLLKELVGTFIVRANDRPEIEIRLAKPPAGLPEVVTDRSKLREVVSNLIDNAIKYTPKGLVSVRALQNGDMVRIEIRDSGIGIPATEMPYLFAKFSRGKDVGRLNAGGTGLGLHVGKSMVEAMGGKIWAESEGDKKGSTFIVELPIDHEEGTVSAGTIGTGAPQAQPASESVPLSDPAAAKASPEPERPDRPEEEASRPTEPPAAESVPAQDRQAALPAAEAPKAIEILRMERPAGTVEPEPEGRIIFNEPRKGKRIV